MGQLSQDACAGLSQTSTASFSLMEVNRLPRLMITVVMVAVASVVVLMVFSLG